MLVLSGCPDGDGNGSTTTSGPGATSPSTSVGGTTTPGTTPGDPEKAAKARAAVIQASDLPAGGWEAKPEDEWLDHETTWRELTACLGAEDSGQGLGSAVSPSFGRGPATQLRSAVEYLPPAKVQDLVTAFNGPKLASCAQQAYTADVKRNAPEGAEVGPIAVAPLDVPKLGQLTSASRATTKISLGFPIDISQDFVVVFKEDSVTRVTFLGAGTPFDPELRQSLLGKVVGRA